MSEPCVFMFVRDGEKKIYADGWAGVLMRREIVWGPKALESFASQLEETSADDLAYLVDGVLVDYDNKRLLWSGDAGDEGILAVKLAFQKLLSAAWPGYEIVARPEGVPVSQRTHIKEDAQPDADEYDDDEDEGPFDYRPETIAIAARAEQSDDDDDEEDEEDWAFAEDETRAWVSLISKSHRVIHVYADQLSADVLQPPDTLAKSIAQLDYVEVPAESVVTEGVVIDIPKKTVSFWGGPDLLAHRDTINGSWRNWQVEWIEGYRAHCHCAGVDGEYMSDAEAAAKFVPVLLTTKRFDGSMILAAMGGGLKKTAAKAAGCLYLVICVPILIFAFFSGAWLSALSTILVTLVLFVVGFKVLERRVTRKFSPLANKASGHSSDETPTTAGPLDIAQREATLNALLKTAGLPQLDIVKQHFDEDGLETLLE